MDTGQRKGEGMRQHFVRELTHVSLFLYVRALTHLYAPWTWLDYHGLQLRMFVSAYVHVHVLVGVNEEKESRIIILTNLVRHVHRYTLHSSNKTMSSFSYFAIYSPFLSPRYTPLFSHQLRIILPQLSAIFITYGPYGLLKLLYI